MRMHSRLLLCGVALVASAGLGLAAPAPAPGEGSTLVNDLDCYLAVSPCTPAYDPPGYSPPCTTCWVQGGGYGHYGRLVPPGTAYKRGDTPPVGANGICGVLVDGLCPNDGLSAGRCTGLSVRLDVGGLAAQCDKIPNLVAQPEGQGGGGP